MTISKYSYYNHPNLQLSKPIHMFSHTVKLGDLELQIRHVEEKDLELGLLDTIEYLTHTYKDKTPEVIYKRAIREMINNPYIVSLVAEDLKKEKIVGFGMVVIIPSLNRGGRPYGTIENIVVHGNYQGRGIGKQIVQSLIDFGREYGSYKLVLVSRKDTHKFYERLGFRIIDEYAMRLNL